MCIRDRLKGHYAGLFVIAGIAAFATALIAIESIMNITIIAGARGWGFYLQLLAGAVGGYTFAQLIKDAKSTKKN